VAEHAGAVFHPAAFRIVRPPIEPPDPRQRYGRRAHGAWLQRDVEARTDETLLSGFPTRGANDQHFGMRRWIGKLARAIAVCRNQGSVGSDQRCTNWHLAAFGGCLRLGQRALHRGSRRRSRQLCGIYSICHDRFLRLISGTI